MESRTRLTVGGIVTVVASVAVITAVVFTNSAALADSAGSPAGTPSIVVPSPSIPPTALPAAPAPVAAVPAVQAEVVPAPEPEDIAAPVTPPSPVAEQGSFSRDQIEADLIAGAVASGSWDEARRWATDRGWSERRVDRWITRLQSSSNDEVEHTHDGDNNYGDDDGGQSWPDDADESTDDDTTDHSSDAHRGHSGSGWHDHPHDSP